MYLMYVDESGDCGMPADGSPSRLFCLSGLVVHELRWRDTMEDILRFRHWIKHRYGVYLQEEIHAGDMINKPKRCAPSLQKLRKHERLAIIRHFADQIAKLGDVSIICVVVDKDRRRIPDKNEVFRRAWYALFQRFENTIRYQNFPGPKNADERGIVFPDNTDGEKLRHYLDAMRLKNHLKVVHRTGGFHIKDEPIRVIVEHPVMRDSRESYLIQAADCACYLLKQLEMPSTYMRRHGGNVYFRRLEPVLCKHASTKDPKGMGIVRL